MAETVLPEGWVVAAAPQLISGRGLVCILRMVTKEAGPASSLLNKMIEIDGRAYSIIDWGGLRAVDLSYEFTLVEFPPLEDAAKEAVDHPAHYGGEANVYEAIKIIEAMGWGSDFCMGNCLKYLLRAGKKGKATELEDLEKARWYLDRRIQQLKSLT